MGEAVRSVRRRDRRWPIADSPWRHTAYILIVDVVVVAWVVRVLAVSHVGIRAIGVLILLAGFAVVFEECVSRAARLQTRLSLDLKRDMVSVWAVAAAVSLPTWSAVLLLIVVLGYVWFRQARPAGAFLHRRWFSGSTEVLGCLVAGIVARRVEHGLSGLPWALETAVGVVLAMVVYTAINRVLVTGALVLVGVRGRALLGTKDDNLIESATLCLGGLVSVAILYNPWLAALALVPMVSLQRGALVHQLEAVATTDAKTGLLNAIALEHIGEREVSRAEREDAPLAVVIIDIDHFKRVNDRYGHLVGDLVLRHVGSVLTSAMREYDSVGRFGGEEFVALLPSTSEPDAMAVAERIRSRVSRLRVSTIDPGLPASDADALSVSIGVACYGIDGLVMSDLLFAADSALYNAKSSGRNRVKLANRGIDDAERESLAF